MKNLNNYNLIT